MYKQAVRILAGGIIDDRAERYRCRQRGVWRLLPVINVSLNNNVRMPGSNMALTNGVTYDSNVA